MQLKHEQNLQEENQASPLGAVGRKGLRGRKKALTGSPITFLKQNRKYSVGTGFQMQIKKMNLQ